MARDYAPTHINAIAGDVAAQIVGLFTFDIDRPGAHRRFLLAWVTAIVIFPTSTCALRRRRVD
jgi:hypothetical protein